MYPAYDFVPVRERIRERVRKLSYLNPHQARDREPDDYQNLLGDAIERSYATGIHDLAKLVAQLNEARVPSPNGQAWTPELFEREMKRLGA